MAKLTTVRTFFCLAAKHNWHLLQLDVHNAFLNGDLDEDLYMKLPPGLVIPGDTTNTMVCKLHKSIYGLKQASRQWNCKLTQSLLDYGFIQSKNDYSLFTKTTKHGQVALLVYVDDILIGGNNLTEVNDAKLYLQKQFKTRELGVPKYFLGIEISRSQKGIYLCQRKYTLEIIKDNNLMGCKPFTIPIEQNHGLKQGDGEELINPTNLQKVSRKIDLFVVYKA